MGEHGWITAKELMRQLEADPNWVAKRDARHAERASRVATDEAAILDDLARVGVEVTSVDDFVGKRFLCVT